MTVAIVQVLVQRSMPCYKLLILSLILQVAGEISQSKRQSENPCLLERTSYMPWVVRIMDSSVKETLATGNIIERNIVLTVCRPFISLKPSDVKVIANKVMYQSNPTTDDNGDTSPYANPANPGGCMQQFAVQTISLHKDCLKNKDSFIPEREQHNFAIVLVGGGGFKAPDYKPVPDLPIPFTLRSTMNRINELYSKVRARAQIVRYNSTGLEAIFATNNAYRALSYRRECIPTVCNDYSIELKERCRVDMLEMGNYLCLIHVDQPRARGFMKYEDEQLTDKDSFDGSHQCDKPWMVGAPVVVRLAPIGLVTYCGPRFIFVVTLMSLRHYIIENLMEGVEYDEMIWLNASEKVVPSEHPFIP